MALHPFRRTADLLIALVAVCVMALVGLSAPTTSPAAEENGAKEPALTTLTFEVKNSGFDVRQTRPPGRRVSP